MKNKFGWEIKKIGDVCDVFNGGTPDTTVKEYWDGDNLWITPKDMGKLTSKFVDKTERKLTDEGVKNSSARLLPINSVIMSSRAPIGHLAINTLPICTNQGCKGMVPKKGLNSNYLYYFLSNSVQLLNDLGSGTTFKEISGTKLSTVKIPVPPLPTQHQIVSELDALSEIISKKKQQIEELDKLAQATFYDMFGDPVTNEKGWEVVPFTDVLVLKRGYDLPVQNREIGNIPIMASNGILGYHNKFMVKGPGVITGRSGTLGQVHYIKEDFWPLNTALYSKNMNGNNSIYILYLLRNFQVERFARGAGVPTLNRNLVHDELIIKTPISIQNQFAAKIESIENQKILINQSLLDVQQLFDYTMDKYFN